VTTTDAGAARNGSAPWEAPARSAPTECFEPALVADLPEPARRWLCHAIASGTPLWRTAELQMHGRLRLGRWRYFTAQQSITPPERFVWAAQTRVAGLPVRGYDRYVGGAGEMHWRLLGLVPVLSGGGPDITRSAAGRLAGEAVLLPTAFASATWHGCADPDRVRAVWTVGEFELQVQLHVGRHGELRDVSMLRWGNPDGRSYGLYPFGVAIEEEHRFGGITIPSQFRAAWWWDTDRHAAGEFFRAHVTSAHFAL
jgi:hypothetical protein